MYETISGTFHKELSLPTSDFREIVNLDSMGEFMCFILAISGGKKDRRKSV
jgi:hypothetical protein